MTKNQLHLITAKDTLKNQEQTKKTVPKTATAKANTKLQAH